jgi:hypothetical protein
MNDIALTVMAPYRIIFDATWFPAPIGEARQIRSDYYVTTDFLNFTALRLLAENELWDLQYWRCIRETKE